MERVLVIGSTGNVGTSACIAALNSGRAVLAVVRNSTSEARLLGNLPSTEHVTTVEADITSREGYQSVVDKVKAGKLPAFQHVYAAAGGFNKQTPLTAVSVEEIQEGFSQNFLPNLYAYQATIPYLLEQGKPSSWTICTGGSGKFGMKPSMAISQNALYGFITCAIRDLANTNIRFNENMLSLRVDIDGQETEGSTSSASYASVYEGILKSDIRGSRVDVCHRDDLTNLKHAPNKGALVSWGTPRDQLRNYLI